MRFATYGRKSIYSDKSDSVSNQQAMCREYVDLKYSGSIDSFDCFQDEGFTGANTNRPGLQLLLNNIENGLIDALVVYQLDRLSRDVKDFANIYSILEEHNVMFISIKENIDTTTPIGKAMMYVTMVFAQMERETIAARVTDNMYGLAKKGFWTGGNPPYGYKREHIIVNGKKHCTIVPVPEAAEYIVNLFKEYRDNNYTIQGMETAFKHQGRRTVNGKFFSSATLYKLLSMPYCAPATPEIWDYYSEKGCTMIDDRNTWDGTTGVMIYGRRSEKSDGFKVQPVQNWIVVKGIHEPFMDAKLWLDVQHQFKHNSFERRKKYDTPLLKGTLRCAKCGYMMQVAHQKMAHGRISSSYFCLKRQRQGIEACDMKFVSCQALDEKVLEIFSEIEADPTSMRKYAQVSEATDNLELQIKKAEKKAASIRNRIKRLTESLAEGSAASKYIVAQIESEDLLLSSTERDIEMLKSRERQLALSERNSESRAESIARMMHTLSNLSAEEKNAIVKEVVQECTWDGSTLILRL